MFPYTHENHFEFGYDGEPFASRADARQRFTVGYGRCRRPPADFRAECVRAARLIRDSTDLTPNVLFSGGSESEMVVRSFVAAGIPVRISIMRFRDHLNRHDIRYALDYCEQMGVRYDLIDLDLLDFWEDDLFDYAEVSHCVSPQLCTTMWLCDQVGGLPIIGGGECYLAADGYVDDPYGGGGMGGNGGGGSTWHLWEREKVAAWYRFFIERQRAGVAGFFQYTPELMYAFLADDWTRRLVAGRIHGEVENETTKLRVYQRHFPVRTREKYTGFERVMEHDRRCRDQLEELHGSWNQVATSEYRRLLGHLGGNATPAPR